MEQSWRDGFFPHIALFEKFLLFDDLPRVGEKFRAVHREGNTPCRTAEQFEAHLVFQLLHGVGKARLRDKKLFCRLGERAALHDLDDVF
jgi:hypothetical protein